MYDVMIIDDDENIRKRLKSIIDWDELELNLTCEAEDSEQSLELFKINKPNIVIVDINIPTVSGIIVAEEMLRLNPDVKVIMMTGYSDVKYARDSIKIGAIDLILKPLDPEEIRRTLKKAIDIFQKQREDQIKSEHILKILHESLPILKEKFISNLLTGSNPITEEAVAERMKTLAPEMINNNYCIAVVVLDISKIPSDKTDIMLVSIQNNINDLLAGSGLNTFSYYDSMYRLICLVTNENCGYSHKVESVISSAKDRLRFYFELDIYAGIGLETKALTELRKSFESAVEALNYVSVFGQNNIVNIKNVIKIDKVSLSQNSNELKNAINSFKTGNLDIVFEELDKYVKHSITTSLGNIEMIKKVYLEYVSAVFRYCMDQGIDMAEIKEADIFYKILTFHDLMHIRQYVISVCEKIVTSINIRRKSKNNILIESAKKFISENIQNENMNLKFVSEYLELSSIYFSQLFHKEQGISFNDYINTLRVEKAKALLKTTTLKVYEISYNVGYSNPKYFNYIFKKYVGLSPIEFKSMAG